MNQDNGQPISKREQHIRYAVMLLSEGLLPSNLPERLINDLDLTPGQARSIAQAALKRRRGEG